MSCKKFLSYIYFVGFIFKIAQNTKIERLNSVLSFKLGLLSELPFQLGGKSPEAALPLPPLQDGQFPLWLYLALSCIWSTHVYRARPLCSRMFIRSVPFFWRRGPLCPAQTGAPPLHPCLHGSWGNGTVTLPAQCLSNRLQTLSTFLNKDLGDQCRLGFILQHLSHPGDALESPWLRMG